ncbi:unnamed protein product [Allacma fusca]|uniref:Uncharacterized protein n=1 Tax=Allacma fusca TaxID=39272 RepID=A0A8J2M7L9_9HEXA|nr:unnamed protein product [Allacma fusca]
MLKLYSMCSVGSQYIFLLINALLESDSRDSLSPKRVHSLPVESDRKEKTTGYPMHLKAKSCTVKRQTCWTGHISTSLSLSLLSISPLVCRQQGRAPTLEPNSLQTDQASFPAVRLEENRKTKDALL